MIPSPDELIDSSNERALERQGYNGETLACAECSKRITLGDAVPMGPQGITGPFICIACAEGISEAQAKGSY